MLTGFLGCIGAIKEVRCLLGLCPQYFAFPLLILIAQVAAGTLFYLNMGNLTLTLVLPLQLKQEMGTIVAKLIQNYKDNREGRLQEAWGCVSHFYQTFSLTHNCCDPWLSAAAGASFHDWSDNAELVNRTNITYRCSCEDQGDEDASPPVRKGFCEAPCGSRTQTGNNLEDWPVHTEVLHGEGAGVAAGQRGHHPRRGGVAVIELLGTLLSICLCRHVHSEDYSKVPKY
ncbi:hypothetical protein MC885_007210 [Smutsia gigantea]|nr:hypothetical protein MC885_007210 [Smutsia gigantea]